MKVIADLHIHSKYSRATSQNMDIPSINRYAQIKGLNVVGTGDFTHPLWLENLKKTLTEASDTSLFCLQGKDQECVHFMLTTEVCTIFGFEGKTRKIHHVILTASIEVAEQINNVLRKKGNLSVDGRPTLSMSAPELVEEIMSVSDDNVIFPAHAWTPWFSLFGSINGFNSLSDCYQDMTKHIFALETGLSSDPPMNWRLSALDNYCFVSNSDSHSPYPYRIGREANVFELKKLSYHEIVDSIRQRDPKRFRFTIETNPAYGKYHWTGHRNCNASMPPSESKKLGGRCPVCNRPLTRGVDERVEELADRPVSFKPKSSIGYVHLLPLQEIIGTILGTENLSTSNIWKIYNSLIFQFGNEYTVLLDSPLEQLAKIVDPKLAEAIVRVRQDQVTVVPGYDGVYGKLSLFETKSNELVENEVKHHTQTSLEKFI
ncbi:MAG: hypothetical protein QG670_821 [Thermoproteota archaeon]|nr:hypothetical protein [Thermoproteota archaeon]